MLYGISSLKPMYHYAQENDSEWNKLGVLVYVNKYLWYKSKAKFVSKVNWTFFK